MGILVLGIIIIFSSIFAIYLFVEFGYLIGFIVPIPLIIWYSFSAYQPLIVEKEVVVEPYNMDWGNRVIQQVSYVKDNGELESINLNERFKAKLPDTTKVKMTFYRNGPYAGLDYKGSASILPTIELVK
jgi:hypothetical protein